MKKQLPFLFLFALSLMSSDFLISQDCTISSAQIDLNANNIRARLAGSGSFWWDGANAQYIFPNNQPGLPAQAAIFAGGLWIGGMDPAANLKIAAQSYGLAFGETDFFPGPLTDIGQTDLDNCARYDRFWKVTSSDIEIFLDDLADNGVIDDLLSTPVMAWPGTGNPHSASINGFDLPTTIQGLAPFNDHNADGIYNPLDGDTPDINGATEGIWWVFNDAGGIHAQTDGDVLNVEVQVLAYAYASDEPAIDNTTFYDFKFINRSVEQIDTTFAGLWIDPDLGCFLDDYVGCSPEHQMAYIYNQDAVDGDANCNCQGVNTYCEAVPMVGIKVLKGTQSIDPQMGLVDNGLSHFTVHYGNSPAAGPAVAKPETPLEHYRYLTGSWRDGTRLTKGGNGYNPNSTDYTNYAFSDPPNDENGWSLCTANLPPQDYRFNLSSGPFTLEPGSVQTMSIAVIIVEDVPHPCPSLEPLIDACEIVQDLFDDQITSSQEIPKYEGIQVFPNPMTEMATISLVNPDQQIKHVKLFSADGRLVKIYPSVNQHQLIINREELNRGMYFYEVYTNRGQQFSGKLLIQ